MKWYKMDCDAQDNLDMRKLVDEWGWDWYGRYWAICGKVGMLVTEKNQTFALQTNDGHPFPVRLLSDDLSTTVERLTNFCQFLADNRLIDPDAWNSKNLIYIPKLKERADEYTRKLLTNSRQTPKKIHPEEEIEVEVKEEKIVYTRTNAQNGKELNAKEFILRPDDTEFKIFCSTVLQAVNAENARRNGNKFVWTPSTGTFQNDMKSLVYKFKDAEKEKILMEAFNLLGGKCNWVNYVLIGIKEMIVASRRTRILKPYAFTLKILKEPAKLNMSMSDGQLSKEMKK